MEHESITKLENKIRKDSDDEISRVHENAAKVVADIQKSSKQEISSYKKEFEKRTGSLLDMQKQQKLAQAALHAKKEKLEKREQLIAGFIDKTVSGLSFKTKAYQDFIASALKSGSQTLGKKIVVYADKRDQALVKDIAKKAGITVSVKDSDIKAGIVMENEKGQKIDESLSSLLERKNTDIRLEISKLMG